jgi:hypothetical protein
MRVIRWAGLYWTAAAILTVGIGLLAITGWTLVAVLAVGLSIGLASAWFFSTDAEAPEAAEARSQANAAKDRERLQREALRQAVQADDAAFRAVFSADARGNSLARVLDILTEELSQRITKADIIREGVESETIRTAANDFYRSWATVTAEFQEAAEEDAYRKSTGSPNEPRKTETLWASADGARAEFLERFREATSIA